MTATESDALAEIKRLESLGRIEYAWPHAYERMAERGAQRRDVRNALATSAECKLQENGRFRVLGGVDLDGDDLTVVVVLEDDVIVVTLF